MLVFVFFPFGLSVIRASRLQLVRHVCTETVTAWDDPCRQIIDIFCGDSRYLHTRSLRTTFQIPEKDRGRPSKDLWCGVFPDFSVLKPIATTCNQPGARDRTK